jgi:hypothetical protein
MSSQTTSKRTHDLKRLVRQTQIQGNVEAVKSMTFDTLAGYLESYAGDMGVMLLNIETTPYRQLLSNLKSAAIDARYVQPSSRSLESPKGSSFMIDKFQNNYLSYGADICSVAHVAILTQEFYISKDLTQESS